MTELPVIVFAFWGRQANVELQLPFIERILDENPHVQFHGWNLANTMADDAYLRSIPKRERFTVRHDFAGLGAQRRLNRVWRHYTAQAFNRTLFVKLDDDVVFLQTDGFDRFVNAIEAHPGTVLSALTINNGASTQLLPELWSDFVALDIPLLDVHMSNEYACAAHGFFFDRWRDVLNSTNAVMPVETWLSINCIGMTYNSLCLAAAAIGKRSPPQIADRHWRPATRIGDEGAVNLQLRAVFPGFTVAHLSFGPQDLTDSQLAGWRARYAEIADEYLARETEGVFRN